MQVKSSRDFQSIQPYDLHSSQSNTFQVNTGLSHMNNSYTNIVETDADETNTINTNNQTMRTSLNVRSSHSKGGGFRLSEVKALELQKLGYQNRLQNVQDINKKFTFAAHRGQKSFQETQRSQNVTVNSSESNKKQVMSEQNNQNSPMRRSFDFRNWRQKF